MPTYRTKIPADSPGTDQIRYAAAYIHPAIRKVWIEDGVWLVEAAQDLDPNLIDAGLQRLTERYGRTRVPESEPLFAVAPPASGFVGNLQAGLDQFLELAPGLAVARPAMAKTLRFLDWSMLERFARPMSAVEEIYPNVIPLGTLSKTNHLTGFPEHLHFVSHLEENLDVLDGYATRMKTPDASPAPAPSELGPAALVHNPSTCYHCYASRQGERLAGNHTITAVTRCHRFESVNHADPGRFLEFTMREVIFVGTPEFVRETRSRTLDLVQDWAQDWQIAGQLVKANDPFFTSEFDVKVTHQHRMAMKYEYRAPLGTHGKSISVLSSNMHSATFGKAFDILVDGKRANTGCIGFGLERMALVIAAQFGLDPAVWPSGLQRDYAAWLKTSPAAV